MGKPYLGEATRVSDKIRNCSTSDAQHTLTWSQTTETVDSFGVQVTAGLGKLVKLGIKTSYRRDWTNSKTEESSVLTTIKPGEEAWVERAPLIQRFTGIMTTHYDSQIDGHYVWRLPDEQYVGPAADPSDQAPVTVIRTVKASC